jgi:hypothetical protein
MNKHIEAAITRTRWRAMKSDRAKIARLPIPTGADRQGRFASCSSRYASMACAVSETGVGQIARHWQTGGAPDDV